MTPQLAAVDVRDHLKWARSVARGVRAYYRFGPGSQEERDLESTAYLCLIKKASQFDSARVPAGGDVGGAFRGWVHPTIRCQCRREAVRLLNGGTYNTRRSKRFDPVVELPRTNRGLSGLYGDRSHELPFSSDGRRDSPADVLDELLQRYEHVQRSQASQPTRSSRSFLPIPNKNWRSDYRCQRRRLKPRFGPVELLFTPGGCCASLNKVLECADAQAA